jgi:FAD/FMN-containing dehydrogenase
MAQGLALMEGIPGEVALPLAYWKSGAVPAAPLDPARDGCGLLWYAPIVPMRAGDVRRFVDLMRSICTEHGFEAPITLTSVSDRSFGSTVPLLFARDDREACRRADVCWRALFEAGRRAGFVPYRLHPRYMPLLAEANLPFWATARRIRNALDPQGLLCPGRYIPTASPATDAEFGS